jgi:regulator of sigma E protease
VLRGGQPLRAGLTPERDPAKGTGMIKLMLAQAPEMVLVRAGPLAAVAKGAAAPGTAAMTLKMIGKMITGEVSLKNVTGPITIADVAGQTARAGAGFPRASSPSSA